jgi:chitin disaccharide deacetylase
MAVCIDDFGLHEGVNAAALALAQMGRVTAISCMAGAPRWRSGAAALAGLPREKVDVGLHLDFTEHPISPASRRSLPALIAWASARLLDRAAVRREIHAQLDAFEQGLGRAPDHVDGHQHVHQFPVLREVLLQVLLERYPDRRPWLRRTQRPQADGSGGIKARIIERLGSAALSAAAREHGFAQNASLLGVYDFSGDSERYLALLREWLAAARERDLLMCHASGPADVSDAILPARRNEYEILAGASFGELLARAGIELSPLSRIPAG